MNARPVTINGTAALQNALNAVNFCKSKYGHSSIK